MTIVNIWYQMVDSEGNNYQDSDVSPLTCDSDENLVVVRERIHAQFADTVLQSVPANALRFFSDIDAFRAFDGPLHPSKLVSQIGDGQKPIIVLIPTVVPGAKRSVLDWCSINHPRKMRWIKLNAALRNSRKRTRSQENSTQYSAISWEAVRGVFPVTSYTQDLIEVSDHSLTSLLDDLAILAVSTPILDTGANEAQRLRYIDMIVFAVCKDLRDVRLSYEQSISGDLVEAHGRYDIMLKRHEIAVCIVEAKKDALEQGLAQDLVCCEVEAEINNWKKVYGIVTNVFQWWFICSAEAGIETETFAISMDRNGVPTRESLKIVTGKIKAMLLKDEERSQTAAVISP